MAFIREHGGRNDLPNPPGILGGDDPGALVEVEVIALDIERYVANYFDPRRNVIVPNIWWGMGLNHECDILVLTKSGFAYEVEIKISKADLKRDLKKSNGHNSNKILRLYFAIPQKLKPNVDLIPERAGIIIVYDGGYVEKLREAKRNPTARRLDANEEEKLYRLAAMRIWKLKREISEWRKLFQRSEIDDWRKEFMG